MPVLGELVALEKLTIESGASLTRPGREGPQEGRPVQFDGKVDTKVRQGFVGRQGSPWDEPQWISKGNKDPDWETVWPDGGRGGPKGSSEVGVHSLWRWGQMPVKRRVALGLRAFPSTRPGVLQGPELRDRKGVRMCFLSQNRPCFQPGPKYTPTPTPQKNCVFAPA